MLVCYLPYSTFYAVVSGASGRFVYRFCTQKKNYLCTWKKNSQHSLIAMGPSVGYQVSICRSWHPNLSSGPHVDLCFDLSFFVGSILWLYQTHGCFFFYLRAWHRVTKNTFGKCSWIAGHKNIIVIIIIIISAFVNSSVFFLFMY